MGNLKLGQIPPICMAELKRLFDNRELILYCCSVIKSSSATPGVANQTDSAAANVE